MTVSFHNGSLITSKLTSAIREEGSFCFANNMGERPAICCDRFTVQFDLHNTSEYKNINIPERYHLNQPEMVKKGIGMKKSRI